MALLAGIIKELNGIVKVKSPNGKIRIVEEGEEVYFNEIIIIEEEGSSILLKTFIPSELRFFDHTHILIDEKLLFQSQDTDLSDTIHDFGEAYYLSHDKTSETIETKIADKYENDGDIDNFFEYSDSNGYSSLTSSLNVALDDSIVHDNTPELTGTVNDENANIIVIVDDNEYEAINNQDGTWTLPDNTLPELNEGENTVTVIATNEDKTDSDTANIIVDTIFPDVEIDDKVTGDNTPELTGTINDPSAKITVIIDGDEYEAVNNQDGTWVLPDNTLPQLDDDTYEVTVIATDDANNQDTDTANLTVDTSLVSVSIADQVTNDNTPELAGTVSKPNAEVTVTIDGIEYEAINNQDGTWVLPDNTLPQLDDGTYHVGVTAVDNVGNIANDTGELTIDATPPEVAVDDLVTDDLTPSITGTVDDPSAKVTVIINDTEYEAINNQDGTWVLPDNVLPALSEGEHITTVAAVDDIGNESEDEGTVIVSLDSPLISIDDLDETEDTTPTFTGMIENADHLEITVNGITYSSDSEVAISGDTWELTLPEGDALVDGDYTIDAIATNSYGKSSNASDDFNVDVKPQITINDYDVVTDRTPVFEGTLSDADIVEVIVNNKLYSSEDGEVIINDDGTWEFTVPDEDSLIAGDYVVNAVAKDPQGNIVNAHDDFTLDTEEPPVANDDIVLSNIIDGSTIEIPETALTFNDTDANYDYIHVESVGNAVNGIVEMPEFVGFTPTTDPFEGGSFEYTATDGKASSNAAHVEIIAVDGNIISGGDDAEILVSGQRNDMMLGGGGNDAFVCYDLSRIVDGGDGFDMLLAPYHDVINFDCFTSRVTNLEVLDVYQGDHDVILVGVNDILSVTDDNNVFKITGDSEDSVSLDPGWTNTEESVTIDTITYNVYTGELGGEFATLQIQEDISVFG